MSEYILPLFFTMFALAIVWLVLAFLLFRSLAKRHPAMHQRIGSPRGFEQQATVALFSFLLTRKPESLKDRALLMHANLMRVLLVVNLLGFVALVYGTVAQQNSA